MYYRLAVAALVFVMIAIGRAFGDDLVHLRLARWLA